MTKYYRLFLLCIFASLITVGQNNEKLNHRSSFLGKKFLYGDKKIKFAEGKKLLLSNDASKATAEKYLAERRIGRISTIGGYTLFGVVGTVVTLKSFTINIFNNVTQLKESYQPTTAEGTLLVVGGAATIFGIFKLLSAKKNLKKAIVLFNEKKAFAKNKYAPQFGITNNDRIGVFVTL